MCGRPRPESLVHLYWQTTSSASAGAIGVKRIRIKNTDGALCTRTGLSTGQDRSPARWQPMELSRPSPTVTSAESHPLTPTTASCVSQPSGGRYHSDASHNGEDCCRRPAQRTPGMADEFKPHCVIFAQWGGRRKPGPTSPQVYTWEALEHGSPQPQRHA